MMEDEMSHDIELTGPDGDIFKLKIGISDWAQETDDTISGRSPLQRDWVIEEGTITRQGITRKLTESEEEAVYDTRDGDVKDLIPARFFDFQG